MLVRRGFPAVSTYQARATFEFCDGRTGEVCHAADITVAVAGTQGMFTAFVLGSDIPALLSKGALETSQGRLDFARHAPTLGAKGQVIPLQMSDAVHDFMSEADFPQPAFAASLFHWAPKTREARLMD